jgi:hypothetical protein
MITAWDACLWFSGFLAGVGACAAIVGVRQLFPSRRRFHFHARLFPRPPHRTP